MFTFGYTEVVLFHTIYIRTCILFHKLKLTNAHSCTVQVHTDVIGHCGQFTDVTELSNKH